MKKIIIFTLAILVLLFIIGIRFYRLGSIPVNLGNDEISIAYDAYSIGHTLRDEHGRFLPISFQSHGDYKAPLYIYFSALPIKIFGNTEFAVRFVSSISGVLSIIFLCLLTYKISKNKTLSALSAIILGLSPWHIYASRIAWESNLAFFFFILAIYLFIVFQEDQKKWLCLLGSSLSFGFSAYSYHIEKILSPLMVVFLTLFLPIKSSIKRYLYWGFTFLLFLPIIFGYFNQLGSNSRANTQMVWNYPNVYDYLFKSNHSIILKFSVLFSAALSNYSAHLNLGHLFFKGLSLLPQKTPYLFGLLLPALLPFLIFGLFNTKRLFGKYSNFLLFWTFFCPLISSLTRGDPNLGRNLPTLAPYCILIAVGIIIVWKKATLILKATIVLSNLFFLLYFLFFYFNHFPVHSGENWQYGYKQIALFTSPLYQKYERIIVDPLFGENNQFVGVPHLYIPYFARLDPNLVLQRSKHNGDIGKYVIKEIDWSKEKIINNSLYVLPVSNLPSSEQKELTLLKTIYYPNGKAAFEIFEAKF